MGTRLNCARCDVSLLLLYQQSSLSLSPKQPGSAQLLSNLHISFGVSQMSVTTHGPRNLVTFHLSRSAGVRSLPPAPSLCVRGPNEPSLLMGSAWTRLYRSLTVPAESSDMSQLHSLCLAHLVFYCTHTCS